MTGHELKDIGRPSGISWRALESFIENLGPTSATARDMNPEAAKWHTPGKAAEILADIFDLLNQINTNLIAVGSGKRQPPPKPYPRPGDKPKTKTIGKDALPITELREWIERKRRP